MNEYVPVVYIYKKDELIETKEAESFEEAENYGKERVRELGKEYWYRVRKNTVG